MASAAPDYTVCDFKEIISLTEREFEAYMSAIYLKINGVIHTTAKSGVGKCKIFLNYSPRTKSNVRRIIASIINEYSSDHTKVKVKPFGTNKIKIKISWL